MVNTNEPVFQAGLVHRSFLQVRQLPGQCSGAVQHNTDVIVQKLVNSVRRHTKLRWSFS